jgi:hypothetical protein
LTIVELETRLLQALQQPLLAYSDIESFRQKMSASFQQYSAQKNNLQQSALFLGAQSATPGMAFLSGYQAALRCLDPHCPTDQFAAFCVSEKGIKKPWDMQTQLDRVESYWQLNGRKGFVMLLPDTIDRLYVVAKREDGSLSCVQLSADTTGLSVTESLNAPFIKDIPHAGVAFDDVIIEEGNILTVEAHQQANKPFRYWEDVHVAIAMAGWMLRKLSETSKFEEHKPLLVKLICQLIAKFEEQPDYYSLEGLNILDECHQLLDDLSADLPENELLVWKTDRLLLQMGLKIRHQIRLKLTKEIPSNT